MKKTIEIKSKFGALLYEYTCENNTVKKTVEEAIKNNISLENVYLPNTYLMHANLRGADLSGADLSEANLSGADLSYADLSGTNLYGINLREAILSNVNLHGADLRHANMRSTYICCTDLRDADFHNANLCDSNIFNIKMNLATTTFFSQCPDGEFIGYKKAGGKIVKLLILADAKRSSATTLECRCSKAKVLEIQNQNGSLSKVKSVRSNYNKSFIYRVGEIVSVNNFDEDRWNECSTGIHFFISREAAVNYR